MNLQINANSGDPTMSSLEIAELCEKRHDHVLRDIRKMLAELELHAPQFWGVYKAGNGQQYECFNLPRRECDILIAGYNIKYRAAIVDRWHELEAKNKLGYDPNNEIQVLEQLITTKKQVAQQAALIEQQKPAVEFVEHYVAATTGSKGFRQVAKLLEANEPQFRAFLSERKIMYKLGNEWMPLANHINAGRFEVKAGVAGEYAYNQAKFTAKGINWIAGLWAQHKLEVSA